MQRVVTNASKFVGVKASARDRAYYLLLEAKTLRSSLAMPPTAQSACHLGVAIVFVKIMSPLEAHQGAWPSGFADKLPSTKGRGFRFGQLK